MGLRRFTASASAVLDASGNATVTLYPDGVDWIITNTAVSVTTQTKMPTATLYLNGVTPASILEGTYSGAGDDSNTHHLVQNSESLWVQWLAGDTGSTATVHIAGIATDPGDGIGIFAGQ